MKKFIVIILALFFSVKLYSQQNRKFELLELPTGTNTNLRGLSVVSDNVIWVCGNNGWTGLSVDAGETWQWLQVKGFEKLDFRDIEAFNEKDAIIANAGAPAYIMKTIDGGLNWKIVYENNDSLAFIDGIDFWDDNRGIAYGDPINGNFLIATSADAGESWIEIPGEQSPKAMNGEASFAASGTAIRTMKNGHVWIGTGGNNSRLLSSSDYGMNWITYDCPILQGEAATGIFSLVFTDPKNGVVVGGDYSKDTLRTNNCFVTDNGGRTWKAPVENPFGYRSGIEAISHKIFIATGTSGTDLSRDGGLTWTNEDKQSYNTVRKAKNGEAVFVAGAKGRVAKVVLR